MVAGAEAGGWVGSVTKGQEATFGGAGGVHYIDCGDVLEVFTCQNVKLHT